MITVSRPAREQVNTYFKDNNKALQPVRIFITNGCGGQQLAMALDNKTRDDAVFTYDGVEYIMQSALLEQAKPVAVDFKEMGFSITSNLTLEGGCGSCSSGSCCES